MLPDVSQDPTDPAVADWLNTCWCNCGHPEAAKEALRGVLDWWELRERHAAYFINLDIYNNFTAKHGEGLATMILYLLEGTGVIKHGGSVTSSWLTDLGVKLKEHVNKER